MTPSTTNQKDWDKLLSDMHEVAYAGSIQYSYTDEDGHTKQKDRALPLGWFKQILVILDTRHKDLISQAQEEILEEIEKGILDLYNRKYSHITRDYRKEDEFRDDIIGKNGLLSQLRAGKENK